VIICDVCKQVGVRALECDLKIIRQDGRPKGKDVKSIPIHLCESCISDFCGEFARFVAKVRDGKPEKQPAK
jgi:hypothetical protein